MTCAIAQICCYWKKKKRFVRKDNITTINGMDEDRVFFCAPEALVTSKWRDAFEESKFSDRIVAIVVDEAHCVSKW